MKKAFVTGWPISHSKSPKLHGFWLQHYKIAGSYEAIGVETENFEKFLGDISSAGLQGGNVTIPHKEHAFDLISNLDDAARAIGAVNTIWTANGELHGSNTDAYGFCANLDDFAPRWRGLKKATVLGAGGASRAIIFGLIESGFDEVRIANRTLSRAESLIEQFGGHTSAHQLDQVETLLSDSDLLVNTTSLGMAGTESDSLPDLTNLPSHALVTDIVYTPLETPLLKLAKARGLETVDGLGMLLHQAVPGFEKWFGIRPEVTTELRNHILDMS